MFVQHSITVRGIFCFVLCMIKKSIVLRLPQRCFFPSQACPRSREFSLRLLVDGDSSSDIVIDNNPKKIITTHKIIRKKKRCLTVSSLRSLFSVKFI